MDKNSRSGIFGPWILFNIIIFISVSFWFLMSGRFARIWGELYLFFRKSDIKTQVLSWKNWDIVTAFALFDIWLSIGIVIFLVLIFRKLPEFDIEKLKQILDLSFPHLGYRLLEGVAGEEIVFRLLPLGVCYNIWSSNFGLWIIVILSSLIFALLHTFNQVQKDRKIVFVLPQFLSGILLSYIFLAFGFWGAVSVHFLINILPFNLLWTANRIDLSLFQSKKAVR